MDAQPPALRWARRHVDLLVAWEPVNRSLTARLRAAPAARTRSFAVFRGRATTLVLHALPRDTIDNDIGELIADELVRPGIVNGPGAFERCFAGLVESTGPSPQAAWRRFYVNTLRALRAAIDGERGDGPVATFAHIYRHAEQLACGASVLDVGSCFAFFPLLLAGRGDVRATASDADPSTVELGRRMAAELALPVAFARADVTRRLPFAPASFDTV
ncbi:MAG: class I SAM-dependent methyltransferase, partial [Solirubrobacteraceae bacterium]